MAGKMIIGFGIAVFLFFIIQGVFSGRKGKAIQEKLNACYEKEDHREAIKLLLTYNHIPGMTLEIRGWYLIYSYFGMNDLKWVRHYREEYYEQMILDSKGRLDIIPQMIEFNYTLLLFVHGEVTEAAEIYGSLAKNIEELEHRAKAGEYFNLYLVTRMADSYHKQNYEDVKEQYFDVKRHLYGMPLKTISTYYMCLIYEQEGKKEEIDKLIGSIRQENNSFWPLLSRWTGGNERDM